jgi:hypothetical protein
MFKSSNLKWGVVVPLTLIGALTLFILVLTGAVMLFDTTQDTSYRSSVTSFSGAGTDAHSLLMTGDEKVLAESETTPEVVGDFFEKDSVLLDNGTTIETKIIKTGSLELVVDDVDAVSSMISKIAKEHGGYVESTNVYERTDGTRYGTIVIRVPVESFEEAMDGAKGYANIVERERISVDDVTEDYVDIVARLTNAKAQEKTYLDILDLATSVEDVLSVQRELQFIRETIEVYQGRLNYLDSQTSLSTITITLSEEPTIQIGGKEFRPGTTIKQASQAVVLLAQALINLIIWLVILGGGIGIPVTLLTWLGIRVFKYRKGHK